MALNPGVQEWEADEPPTHRTHAQPPLDPYDPLAEINAMSSAEYNAFMADVDAALDEMRAEEQAARPVRERMAEGLDTASRGLSFVGALAQHSATVLDGDLTDAIEAVGALQTQLGAVGFTLAREAAVRGLHQDVAMSLVDWLRVRCPWLSTQDAAQISAIVRASQSPVTTVIGDAVADGSVPVHRAALVARTMTRLESSLDPTSASRMPGSPPPRRLGRTCRTMTSPRSATGWSKTCCRRPSPVSESGRRSSCGRSPGAASAPG
ncbi:hypothetical protein [Serinicoccus marinus]|uniref:hypothetical protein n=1 Tax=Serinicoccus marinus TaxID=247333 RepID=UPI001EE95EF1|nr:hypothetical protein [Serinicoccus marinus]